MMFAPAGSVVKGSDPTKLQYELSNIELEYEVIHSKELSDKLKLCQIIKVVRDLCMNT